VGIRDFVLFFFRFILVDGAFGAGKLSILFLADHTL
jgi:hypothetical protein